MKGAWSREHTVENTVWKVAPCNGCGRHKMMPEDERLCPECTLRSASAPTEPPAQAPRPAR